MSFIRRLLVCLVITGALALSACQSTPGTSMHPDDSLTHTYWKLMSVDGRPIQVQPNQREPHIVLVSEDQRVRGFSGCNILSGQYRQQGQDLNFEQIASTRMFCDGAMRNEQAFLDALNRSAEAHIEGNELTLSDADGKTLARFESRLMQ